MSPRKHAAHAARHASTTATLVNTPSAKAWIRGLTVPIGSGVCPCIVEYHTDEFYNSDDETSKSDAA